MKNYLKIAGVKAGNSNSPSIFAGPCPNRLPLFQQLDNFLTGKIFSEDDQVKTAFSTDNSGVIV